MKKFLQISWVLFFFQLQIFADQSVNIVAQVQPNPSTLQQQTYFIITSDQPMGKVMFNLPRIKGIRLQFETQSARTYYFNGVTTRLSSWSFRLIPSQEGDFVIPSFQMTGNGKTYIVPETKFSIKKTAQTSKEEDSSILLLLSGAIPNKWYVGQCQPAQIQLLIGPEIQGQLTSYPRKSCDAFSASKLIDTPKKDVIERNGELYSTFSWPTLLTALKSGDAAVGFSVTMEIDRSIGNLFDDDDLMNTMMKRMGLAQREPVTLNSKSRNIQILPLPTPKPQAFTQAIGQFKMLPPRPLETEFIQNEPLTYIVKITGSGNFESIQAPELKIDETQWRSYEPKITFESKDELGFNGTLNFAYPLVPLKKGEISLPAVEFCFFNPTNGRYETLTQSSIMINVKPSIHPASQAVSPASAATNYATHTNDKQDELQFQSKTDRNICIDTITWVSPVSYFWTIQICLCIITIFGIVYYLKTHTKNYDVYKAYKHQMDLLEKNLDESFQQKKGIEVYVAAYEQIDLALKNKGFSVQSALRNQNLFLTKSQLKLLENIATVYDESRFSQTEVKCPKNISEIKQFIHSIK